MHFIVDANMRRSTVGVLHRLGHTAVHVRDIGLGDASDEIIAEKSRELRAALITRDLDFADMRNYPPARHGGLLVMRMPDHSTAVQIVRLLETFLQRSQLVAMLPGHLAILEEDRVRFRPALGNEGPRE